jgi:hypothetical protein
MFVRSLPMSLPGAVATRPTAQPRRALQPPERSSSAAAGEPHAPHADTGLPGVEGDIITPYGDFGPFLAQQLAKQLAVEPLQAAQRQRGVAAYLERGAVLARGMLGISSWL